MVDLSAGVPAGLHDMMAKSLREVEANEAMLGFDRPNGYVIHMVLLPSVNDPEKKNLSFRVGIKEVEDGKLSGFLYEINVMTDNARTGVGAEKALCLGGPGLLKLDTLG